MYSRNITTLFPAVWECSSVLDVCWAVPNLCIAVVLADLEETPILLEGFCSVAIFSLWAFHCQGNPSGFGFSGSPVTAHTADHEWLFWVMLELPVYFKSTSLAISGQIILLCCASVGVHSSWWLLGLAKWTSWQQLSLKHPVASRNSLWLGISKYLRSKYLPPTSFSERCLVLADDFCIHNWLLSPCLIMTHCFKGSLICSSLCSHHPDHYMI